MLDFLSIIADITRLNLAFPFELTHFTWLWMLDLFVDRDKSPRTREKKKEPFVTHHVWYYRFDSGESVVGCGCGPP